MAQIKAVKGKRGTMYKAGVRRAGYPDTYKTFDSKQDAIDWAADLERDIRDRKIDPERLAHRHRLHDAIEKYLKEKIAGTKKAKDTTRLLGWWSKKLGTTLLSELTAPSISQTLNTLSVSGATKNRYLGALIIVIPYLRIVCEVLPRQQYSANSCLNERWQPPPNA